MNKKKLVSVIMAVCLLAGFLLAGCGKQNSTGYQAAAGKKSPSEVWVLKVDDEEVYLNEVNFYALSLLQGMGVEKGTDMSAYYSDTYPTLDSAFKAQLLAQMRQTKILYLKAVERGLTLSPEEEEEMNGLVDDFIDSYDSETQEKYGFDRDVLVKIYTEMGLIKKLEKTLQEETEFEEQEYGAYYNFVFVTIQLDSDGNAVLDTDGSYIELAQSEKDAQYAKAEEVLGRLQEGEDPEKLIKEYDLSATSGLTYATTDTIKNSIKLKNGEVSDIITNDYGYTIQKMISTVDAEYTDSVNGYMESAAKSDAVEQQEQEWFDSYMFGADDLNNEVWEKFTFQELVQ